CDFLMGKLGKIFQMRCVTLLQQLVGEHFAKRGRDIYCQTRPCAGFMQVLEYEDERKVNFGDGFEKPVFLEKLGIFRMPNERKVRVKDKTEIAGRHNLFVGTNR